MMTLEALNYLIRNHPTPFYVFDEIGFINNYKNLQESMRRYYDNYEIGYSYKTNYTPYVCNIVKSLGGYAEVVSDMELSLARKLGYNANRIIYNGPCKGIGMESHISEGGILNIDSLDEALRVRDFCMRHPEKTFRLGIRINTDIGAGFISRFGIDCSNGDLSKAVELLKSAGNIRIAGLHIHVSRARSLEAWKNRVESTIEIADKYLDDIPDYIDLGSGMFADMENSLKEQFDIHIPTYDEYAKVVAEAMQRRYAGYAKRPVLFTEPGTTLVSRYFSLFTTIVNIKNIRNNYIAVADCDIHNAGETCTMMNLPYRIHHSGNGRKIGPGCKISGYTCLEQDILYKSFPETMAVGDIIEFKNVGGYSIVYKPPFIQPQCAVYAVNETETKEIKREETFDDIFRTFIF